jgi:hypothetical protein
MVRGMAIFCSVIIFKRQISTDRKKPEYPIFFRKKVINDLIYTSFREKTILNVTPTVCRTF